jgi:hypothetical protein
MKKGHEKVGRVRPVTQGNNWARPATDVPGSEIHALRELKQNFTKFFVGTPCRFQKNFVIFAYHPMGCGVLKFGPPYKLVVDAEGTRNSTFPEKSFKPVCGVPTVLGVTFKGHRGAASF